MLLNQRRKQAEVKMKTPQSGDMALFNFASESSSAVDSVDSLLDLGLTIYRA